LSILLIFIDNTKLAGFGLTLEPWSTTIIYSTHAVVTYKNAVLCF